MSADGLPALQFLAVYIIIICPVNKQSMLILLLALCVVNPLVMDQRIPHIKG